jgi:hypothetical protein
MIHTTTNDNTTTNGHNNHGSNNISRHPNIVNFTNYESALGLSNSALDKFHNEIKPSIQSQTGDENNTTNQNYLEKLENGLVELNNSIKNKENAMKVMEIVPTIIHPNLQILFNLQIS